MFGEGIPLFVATVKIDHFKDMSTIHPRVKLMYIVHVQTDDFRESLYW